MRALVSWPGCLCCSSHYCLPPVPCFLENDRSEHVSHAKKGNLNCKSDFLIFRFHSAQLCWLLYMNFLESTSRSKEAPSCFLTLISTRNSAALEFPLLVRSQLNQWRIKKGGILADIIHKAQQCHHSTAFNFLNFSYYQVKTEKKEQSPGSACPIYI